MNKGGIAVTISYKKLFKLMIDRDLKRKDLQRLTGISASSIAKLSRDEYVIMDVLIKICSVFDAQMSDVVEIVYNTPKEMDCS